MPNLDIKELSRLYKEADEIDREVFAEQRSNVLLVTGDHYTKKASKFWNRVRDDRGLDDEKKLRITKNYIQKFTKKITNNILKYAPGVAIGPQLETELQDVKAAEMHNSVWQHYKRKHKIKKKIAQYAKDFVEIGEVFVKVYFDPSLGKVVGYEQAVDELGNPMFDEVGNPVPDENKPSHEGDFVFERIFAFNVLRCPSAKDMDESPYLIVRKMIDRTSLVKKIDDLDVREKIQDSKDETYMVFDGDKGQYKESKGQVLLKEFYYRPCAEYPQGYFYICACDQILWEGELPAGVFPILHEGWDEAQTTARKRSIIKQLRHFQVEINRSASARATHQVTLGDDKLVVNNQAKLEHGSILPGVRVIRTNGYGNSNGITVIPGRTGDQYAGYGRENVEEMAEIANAGEDDLPKNGQGAIDPYMALFASISKKKEYMIYTEKFEDFLTSMVETFLRLAKYHLDENSVIQVIGKRELINISEFKNSEDLGWEIKLEPATDDPESLIGKQLMINHTLQYVGNQLSREDIGKVLRESPMGNFKNVFEDFTIDYDNVRNDMLMLERGQMPGFNKYDNHKYIIKMLVHRTRQADFRFLSPEIQQMFFEKIQLHEQIEAEQALEMQRAQSGFIPTGGYMVKADFYVSSGDGKTQRATIPYEAMAWLIKKLEDQGMAQKALLDLQQGAVADISQMVNETGIPQGQLGV